MELTTTPQANLLFEMPIDCIHIASILPEDRPPIEERLNFIATFTAENGAELKFEFHCSDSAEAIDHIEGLAYYFKKDLHFLRMSGESWNVEPDKLVRVAIKRKIEIESQEFEVIDTSFSLVRPDLLQLQSA